MKRAKETGHLHPLAGRRVGLLGKGGSGKTTLAVVLARALVRRGYDVVVVDADSTNEGLHRAMGIADPPRPLLAYFGGSVFSGGAVTCPVDDPTFLPAATIDVKGLPEAYVRCSPDGVWLLVVGKLAELGAGAGCDGPIAKITRDVDVRSGSQLPVVLFDLKAGFEDSARGVLVRLDAAIVVVDPTIVAVRMAADLTRLVRDVRAGAMPATRHLADPGLVAVANRLYAEARVRDVFVLLNKIADTTTERTLRRALEVEGVSVTGVLHADSAVVRAWLLGDVLDSRRLNADMEAIVDRIEASLARDVPPVDLSVDRSMVGGAPMTRAERRSELGPGGHCVCPKCGTQIEHRHGIRCEQERCPGCAAKMLREGSRHHRLWLAKHRNGTTPTSTTEVTT